MNWDYHEIKPKSSLTDYIDCIWWENYSQIHPKNQSHLLVPDLSIELIFTTTEISRVIPGKKQPKERKSQLAGLRTTPQLCSVRESPLICIRFKPKTFYRLCRSVVAATINSNLPPAFCFGESVLELEKNLKNAFDQEERIRLIHTFFEKFVLSETPESDPVFEEIFSYLESRNGDCLIRELPKLFHTSASTIERKFKKRLGLTPKKYCSLLRFHNHLLLRKGSFEACSRNLGFTYYDQAHFIKEMNKFSGLTPKQLAAVNMGIQEVCFRN